jgi:hypothetical protein
MVGFEAFDVFVTVIGLSATAVGYIAGKVGYEIVATRSVLPA